MEDDVTRNSSLFDTFSTTVAPDPGAILGRVGAIRLRFKNQMTPPFD